MPRYGSRVAQLGWSMPLEHGTSDDGEGRDLGMTGTRRAVLRRVAVPDNEQRPRRKVGEQNAGTRQGNRPIEVRRRWPWLHERIKIDGSIRDGAARAFRNVHLPRQRESAARRVSTRRGWRSAIVTDRETRPRRNAALTNIAETVEGTRSDAQGIDRTMRASLFIGAARKAAITMFKVYMPGAGTTLHVVPIGRLYRQPESVRLHPRPEHVPQVQ